MVQLVADHIISAVGFDTFETFEAIRLGRSGLSVHTHPSIGPYIAAKINRGLFQQHFRSELLNLQQFTFLEQLCIVSIQKAAAEANVDLKSQDTLLVFSSTKGNIDLLSTPNYDLKRIRLGSTAQFLGQHLGNPNQAIVVSNACISGVQALVYALQVLKLKTYTYVIVCGVDIISDFVISGFHSFQALSPSPCKPFDLHRTGLNIGEACATMVLSLEGSHPIVLETGASANDANHLSGPSRTGKGLTSAIHKVLKASGLSAADIDYISAHGTATPYNDEMEALALQATQLDTIPINSLKGYFGHTLGAAGVLETVITAQCLQQNTYLKSQGFEVSGVSVPIPVIAETTQRPMRKALKTASGFGGGNAALLLSKQ